MVLGVEICSGAEARGGKNFKFQRGWSAEAVLVPRPHPGRTRRAAAEELEEAVHWSSCFRVAAQESLDLGIR
jgi:hypothetical protein